MKRCSTLADIRDMQANNASKIPSHPELLRKQISNINVCENPRKENSVYSVRDMDEFSRYGNQYKCSQTSNKHHMTPALPLLGSDPKDIKLRYHKGNCRSGFTAAWSRTAKWWNQVWNPRTEEMKESNESAVWKSYRIIFHP